MARPDKMGATATAAARNPFLVALADALAGALGSVVAALAFYPIDIAKVRAQAQRRSADGAGKDPKREGAKRGRSFFRSRTLAALVSLIRKEGPFKVFAGIESKSLQALLGSFVYFYSYAFIKGILRRRTGGSLRPSHNLLAAALAGAVNQTFTLPLENITTFLQTAGTRSQSRGHARASGDPAGGNPSGMDRAGDAGALGGRSEPSGDEIASRERGNDDEGSAVATDVAGRETTARTGRDHHPIGGESRDFPEDVDSTEKEDVDEGRTTGVAERADMGRGLPLGGAGRSIGPGVAEAKDGRIDGGGEEDDEYRSEQTRAPSRSWRLPTTRTVRASRGGTSQAEEGGQQQQQQRGRRRPRQSLLTAAWQLYREGDGFRRFWRGYAPSLILTCNPAINYTAFDLVKALWLKRRAAIYAAAGASSSLLGGALPAAGAATDGFLNPVEAFLIAAAAKSLATLVTYPLIRAKVILMTGAHRARKADEAAPTVSSKSSSNGHSSAPSTETNETVSKSKAKATDSPTEGGGPSGIGARNGGGDKGAGVSEMARVLFDIVHMEGVGGLYAGCGAQLLHTILKSALLLATKEEISRAVFSAIFYGQARSEAPRT